MLISGRFTQRTLVLRVESMLLDTRPPHILPVFWTSEDKRRRSRLLLTLDTECSLVVDDVCDITPSGEK